MIRGWDWNVRCWGVCTVECSLAVMSAVAQDALHPAALISSGCGKGTELGECLDSAGPDMWSNFCVVLYGAGSEVH